MVTTTQLAVSPQNMLISKPQFAINKNTNRLDANIKLGKKKKHQATIVEV